VLMKVPNSRAVPHCYCNARTNACSCCCTCIQRRYQVNSAVKAYCICKNLPTHLLKGLQAWPLLQLSCNSCENKLEQLWLQQGSIQKQKGSLCDGLHAQVLSCYLEAIA